MRVIETVRTSQCPRCGKPPNRCRCDLKKSIRQRTKCVFSYIFSKVADTEKESSIEAPSPFLLNVQSPDVTTDDDALLAERGIICPRCIKNQERSRISPEVNPISNTVCQHCMLRAQIYKLKAEKIKSRLQSRDDHYHIKQIAKDDKLEIIYMSKKYQTTQSESKPSCEEQDAVLEKSPKATKKDVPGKVQKFNFSPTVINTLRPKSMHTDLSKTQNMLQNGMDFLTYYDDRIQMQPIDVEKKIEFNAFIAEPKVKKTSAFSSASTISNLRELKHKIQLHYSESQLADICKRDQVIQMAKGKLKKPDTVLRNDQLTQSSSQEIMSYRFLNASKNVTVYKQTTSSALITRTREELLAKEPEKKLKEKDRILARKSGKEKRLKERVDFNMKQKYTQVQKQEQKTKLEVKKEELSDIPKEKDQKRENEKVKNKLEIGEISKRQEHIKDDSVNKDKLQKEKGMPDIHMSQKQNSEAENVASKKNKNEAERRKKTEEEETDKNKKEKEVAEKKKFDEQEAPEKKKKKEDEETVRSKNTEEKVAKKERKDEESAKKCNKSDADAIKVKEDMESLKNRKGEEEKLNKEQENMSNKKQDADLAKTEKEPIQVAKPKIKEESPRSNIKKEGKEAKKRDTKKKKDVEEVEKMSVKQKKDKQAENEKPSREKRQLQTDSELMIFKLIREHKVKRAEERMLLAEQNIIADRQKLTEMAKKKIEADKKKLEAEQADKTRQIEHKFSKRTQESILAASSADFDVFRESKHDKAVKIKKSKITEIIIGDNICKSKFPLPPVPFLQNVEETITPLLFRKKSVFSDHLDAFSEDNTKQVEEKNKDALTGDENDTKDGIFRYALSDRSFIENGWTVLPVEEVVRKMNVYRMRPAQPEFDWFERNKNKRHLLYNTGEKLAVFDDQGGCRWYYKNGRLALDYYNSEELNSQHRYVVYSNGEPDERGRSRPYTVLATFSHLGTGVVFDHGGKIRLKYNQTEGILLDRDIGPVTTWKWHSLNDPPVLRQVMINSKLIHKDQTILNLGEKDDDHSRKEDDLMIAVENENSLREMQKKQSLDFKPFQIKTKVLKINENFSLKVLDQTTIYLIFREGSAHIKLNIGMLLDHHEIVDTDTASLGVVSNCVERLPAATDSIAALQRSVEHAQRFERNRTARDRLIRQPLPVDSADRLVAGLSRPLKVPLNTLSISQTASKINVEHFKCSRKPSCNLYYNSRLP